MDMEFLLALYWFSDIRPNSPSYGAEKIPCSCLKERAESCLTSLWSKDRDLLCKYLCASKICLPISSLIQPYKNSQGLSLVQFSFCEAIYHPSPTFLSSNFSPFRTIYVFLNLNFDFLNFMGQFIETEILSQKVSPSD